MSRYGDDIPTSHIPAYPHHHASTSSAATQHYAPIQPASYYGSPPPVPASLYAAPPQGVDMAAGEQPSHRDPECSKGRDYLRSLGSGMMSLSIGSSLGSAIGCAAAGASRIESGYDKPLPGLPREDHCPDLPHRPLTDPGASHSSKAYHSPPETHLADIPSGLGHSSVDTLAPTAYKESQKYFKPSPYLILPHISPDRRRPKSDSSLPLFHDSLAPTTPPRRPRQDKHRSNPPIDVIDLTNPSSPASAGSSPTWIHSPNVTPRSPARIKRRALSEQPPVASASSPSSKAGSGSAMRCAGYTRTGQPCKRLVKVQAPFLSVLDQNLPVGGDDDQDGMAGRYCKDHAGMICSAKGFYSKEKPGIWIEFEDWIPPELGQQTQTLLRMTMESRLTAKESPGFIYVYELRDLQTPQTCFFKVGRTDNVPRRIGQWSNQCQSKTPTLRDIFPLSASRLGLYSGNNVQRTPTITKSLLPGAVSAGTLNPASSGVSEGGRESPAVKRWERLIHLELAEMCAVARPKEWEKCREKCDDCGTVHREIFPVPRDEQERCGGGEGSYQVVVEIVSRWERYVRYVVEGV